MKTKPVAKNERRPCAGSDLVGMVIVDVNRNALGEIVLFLEKQA